MPRRQFVEVAGRRLVVSEHAWKRYQERVRPTLSLADARVDLERVLAFASFGPCPDFTKPREPVDEWVLLGDDVAFLVQGRTLVSCVVRGLVGDEMREARAAEKRSARATRAGRRKKVFGRRRAQERVARNRKRGDGRDE